MLESSYEDEKDEWEMIVVKARKWVRKNKVVEDGKKKEIEGRVKELMS